MSKKVQLMLIIFIGLLMGTVFVFGFSYWNSEVDRTECTQSYPIYESHKLTYHRGSVKEIIIYFSNDELLVIDGVSVNNELITEIDKLNSNSKLIVLYHPNSNIILEMTANGEVLLDFDTTMTKITNERNGFILLGCIMYLFVVISIIELIKMMKKK
ncbi:MAG: hypothetical protein IKC45_04255 [Clostridia bacterium]|nr:hypothetical protein [Clostridia bacterium]